MQSMAEVSGLQKYSVSLLRATPTNDLKSYDTKPLSTTTDEQADLKIVENEPLQKKLCLRMIKASESRLSNATALESIWKSEVNFNPTIAVPETLDKRIVAKYESENISSKTYVGSQNQDRGIELGADEDGYLPDLDGVDDQPISPTNGGLKSGGMLLCSKAEKPAGVCLTAVGHGSTSAIAGSTGHGVGIRTSERLNIKENALKCMSDVVKVTSKTPAQPYHSSSLIKPHQQSILQSPPTGSKLGPPSGSPAAASDRVLLGNGLYLTQQLMSTLYSYQKEGVLWMWNLFRQSKGGVLADDMGLGKTIQVVSFLSGLFDSQLGKLVLVVVPKSLITYWKKEVKRWSPTITVYDHHAQPRSTRHLLVAEAVQAGGVVITTYSILTQTETERDREVGAKDKDKSLTHCNGKCISWDCMVLDEGHRIKNWNLRTAKGANEILSRCRIVLTGTPVQNNLQEMWALFTFTHRGMLLGQRRLFKLHYEVPITRGVEKCATPAEKALGQATAKSLLGIIEPYFLRRTKNQVNSQVPEMPRLTRKNDLVVWVRLSNIQQNLYAMFLDHESVKTILERQDRSPLTALVMLKKVCDSPRLMTVNLCKRLGVEMGAAGKLLSPDQANVEAASNRIADIPDQVLISESGKMVFLVSLLDRLKDEGHRTLVFSQSRRMLDIIEKVMNQKGHMILRLDGSVHQLHVRDHIVNTFQTDQRYSSLLLTTQVGGVGLNLTAASRVVIFDPSWNPATDSQAVDRAFRIGQLKNVVVYRLITCGTVEEKIYRRQVFKDSVSKQATSDIRNPVRYFTKLELRELFKFSDPDVSETQKQLEVMHASTIRIEDDLKHHISFLNSNGIFGISHHDLMFSVEEAEENMSGQPETVIEIQQRVAQAHANLSNDLTQATPTHRELSYLPSSAAGCQEHSDDSYSDDSLDSWCSFAYIDSSSSQTDLDSS